jgi:hypothetical protein
MVEISAGTVHMETAIEGSPLPELVGNISMEMQYLKRSIDDVFIISNGIVVCCKDSHGLYSSITYWRLINNTASWQFPICSS